MSIRFKLAWTFILLLIFGITAISSYSILFIRNYLLTEGEIQLQNDTEWLSITLQNLQFDDTFETNLNEAARTSGYRLAVYDEDGALFAFVPYNEVSDAPEYLSAALQNQLKSDNKLILDNREDSDRLVAFTVLTTDLNPARFLQVSQFKDEIYAPIKTIRWIIYTGMFISMGLVILVSVLFARYISRPILQLEQSARKIAAGDVDQSLNLNRNDEFGTLAESLNSMASRLRADSEEMKKLYEKQSQFFADITHELRNPLHTIAGSLEMLEMKNLPEHQKDHYVRTAMKQTERINRLFKDLVTLQRYDSDTYFIEKSVFNLPGVIIPVFEMYYPRAKEKGIEIETDTEEVWVKGDPDKIEQIIDNLVSNAVKYTNDGKIEIRYKKKGKQVEISILDTGIGISEEHLGRLFDRFYRTDKARSRDKGGTGLGLSVVKSILSAHDTDIKIVSTPGEGSIFSFQLPAVSAPAK
jgi:signal transduction histidine kinase